ncbi:hypothetical protein [Streptomyces sp. NPDC001250]
MDAVVLVAVGQRSQMRGAAGEAVGEGAGTASEAACFSRAWAY